MKSVLCAGVALFALSGGIAAAQTDSETTTSRTVTTAAMPPVAVPPPGAVQSERVTQGTDAYGNPVVSRESSYRDANGVAQDSRSVTTTAPAYPPAQTTTTTTESTTTTPPR